MQFQLAPHRDYSVSNMTSNITSYLGNYNEDELFKINPKVMAEAFGERYPDFQPGDYEYSCKGYTDPVWYFTGPGDTVLGIGFRYGTPRLRGKNLDNQWLTPQEICEAFLQHVLCSIKLVQVDKQGGE